MEAFKNLHKKLDYMFVNSETIRKEYIYAVLAEARRQEFKTEEQGHVFNAWDQLSVK